MTKRNADNLLFCDKKVDPRFEKKYQTRDPGGRGKGG